MLSVTAFAYRNLLHQDFLAESFQLSGSFLNLRYNVKIDNKIFDMQFSQDVDYKNVNMNAHIEFKKKTIHNN